MKKSLIAAVSCFVVGVVGLTCTLPMAAQEGVSLYNDVVSNLEENLQKQDLPQEITSLRVIHLTDYGYGQRFIEVRQSPDAQIHLYTADGDTAQVGPQVAEKLGLPQVTYAEDILDITAGKITIKRRLERGIEVVESPVPCVVTVNGSAAPCRPRNARYVMKYKYARATQEMQDADEDYLNLLQERPYLKITEWSVNDITCEAQELGLSGSPTKVKNIESVVFQAKEAKVLEPSDTAIDEMMKELIVNHTVG